MHICPHEIAMIFSILSFPQVWTCYLLLYYESLCLRICGPTHPLVKEKLWMLLASKADSACCSRHAVKETTKYGFSARRSVDS